MARRGDRRRSGHPTERDGRACETISERRSQKRCPAVFELGDGARLSLRPSSARVLLGPPDRGRRPVPRSHTIRVTNRPGITIGHLSRAYYSPSHRQTIYIFRATPGRFSEVQIRVPARQRSCGRLSIVRGLLTSDAVIKPMNYLLSFAKNSRASRLARRRRCNESTRSAISTFRRGQFRAGRHAYV